MSQRSQKQKDADELAKERQTYGTRNEEGDKVGKVADIRYPDAGANLARNPATGQPTVAPTPQEDNSDEESTPGFRNGFVDGPGPREASSARADAKRDASPDQMPKLVVEDQPDDSQ
jgi:hypothetical protein